MAKGKKGRQPDPDWQEAWAQASRKQGAMVLRAQGSCGPILGYSFPPVPEGLTLILPADMPKNSAFQVFRYKVPLLAEGEVKYPGEPVGLICSTNPKSARDWARSFRVITAPPGKETSPEVNRTRNFTWGAPPSPEEGDWTFRRSYTSSTQSPQDFLPLRVRVLTKNQQIWIQAPTQWPKNLLEAAARAADRDRKDLVVFPSPGFIPLDSRLWYPSWAAAVTTLLHITSGFPVELEFSKEEEQEYLPRRPGTEITLEATVNARGELKSLDADITLFTGALGILDGEILDRMILGVGNFIKVPHLSVRARSLLTPTPPRGPTGTWGEETTQTALGLFLSDLCGKMEENPALWLRSQLPQDSPGNSGSTALFTGAVLKEPPLLGKLTDQIVQQTDFHRKHSACAALGKRNSDSSLRFHRGMGFSMGFSGTGFIASGTSPATMVMEWASQDELVIQTTLAGDKSHLAQGWIARTAAALEIPENRIRIQSWITADTPDGGPSTLCRGSILGGRLLSLCLEQLQDKKSKGLPFPRRAEKTYRRPLNLPWNSDTFSGVPFVAFTRGTAVAEVEWDRVFSRICLRKLSLHIFCGPLENPQAARSAVLSGVQAALGWCLVENPETQPWSSQRFLRKEELPEIQLTFHPSDTKLSPRGVGTIPWSLVPPAVLAAVSQATGTPVTHWPLRRQDFPENRT